jgi:hypothetical protein
LLRIDTGKVDEHGERIMIDLASYDKDYWNVVFNTMTGRPDKAVTESIKRIGGMKATTFEMLHDLQSLFLGKALYDWKEDRVYYPTDPFIEKMTKLVVHEIQRLEPISVSVFRRSQEKGVDDVVAILESFVGLRTTMSEAGLGRRDALHDCFELRGKREELSYRLDQYSDPWGAVENYNSQVKKVLNAPFVTEDMKKEWGKKLLIDPKNVVSWKRFPASEMTDQQLVQSIREHTYKSAYRREDGRLYPPGYAHAGYERRIEELKAELKRRRK